MDDVKFYNSCFKVLHTSSLNPLISWTNMGMELSRKHKSTEIWNFLSTWFITYPKAFTVHTVATCTDNC